MVEFEFKCPQCGETVIADETLCGQVQLCPNCEKGIVVPRNIPKTQSIDVEYKADVTANCQVKLKPIKRQTENTSIPQSDDGRRLSEFERMCIREQERRIREKRQTLLITSIKATVVVILICTVGVFAFSWWQQRKQEEFRIKQEEIRREIAIREQKIQEEARLAKESAEKAEKASRAFHAYLDKEEARLKVNDMKEPWIVFTTGKEPKRYVLNCPFPAKCGVGLPRKLRTQVLLLYTVLDKTK